MLPMKVGSSVQPFQSIFPSWVVVDNYICRKEPASFRDEDLTSAEVCASNGELIRVSFILRALPDASRLCIHCPEGREMSDFDTVVAAHGSAVLFRLEIDYEGLPVTRYPVDYFIYWASPYGPRISLLPRHYSTEDEIEAAEVGSWRRNPRSRLGIRGTGLLTDDGGNFVVAELHLDLHRLEDDLDAPLEAQLFRLRSDLDTGGGEWEIKHAGARGGKAKFRDLLYWWAAHVVVPYGSYLCWVDYSRGMIFCDVFHSNPDLQYLLLPVDHITIGYPDPCRIGWPQASRAVCVTNNGTMKFINIARSDGMLSEESKPGSSFTITIWTLVHRGYDNMEWEKDVTIESAKLWDMGGYHSQLPRIAPQFPLMSMDDPNIIYFVLKKNYSYDAGERAWLVGLDMGSSKILWYKSIEATTSDDDAEMSHVNIFCGFPFFPTEFSKHLQKVAPRWREFSGP